LFNLKYLMISSGPLMNINTRQLKAFVQIARLQSFTKAAEQVHISQAGLSMMIKELEGQLGSRLFERTTRSVTLTDAGRRLQPVASRVIEELESVGSAIGEANAKAVSTLRVAATPLVSASLLPSSRPSACRARRCSDSAHQTGRAHRSVSGNPPRRRAQAGGDRVCASAAARHPITRDARLTGLERP
jgi:molybdenum-dependent DNA-binding transcriptional regulator ModE